MKRIEVNPYPERGLWKIMAQKKRKIRWEKAIYFKLPFAEVTISIPPGTSLIHDQLETISNFILSSENLGQPVHEGESEKE